MAKKVANFDEMSFRWGGNYELTESLTGFKKIKCKCPIFGTNSLYTIAKLKIPAGQRVVISPYGGGKIRTDGAIVEEIELPFFQRMFGDCKCFSMYDGNFPYNVGDKVVPKNGLDTDSYNTCVSGIHFFKDKSDAENLEPL